MPESLVFKLRGAVRCADGDCGQIKSMVISPSEDVVTHLVVEPVHEQDRAVARHEVVGDPHAVEAPGEGVQHGRGSGPH